MSAESDRRRAASSSLAAISRPEDDDDRAGQDNGRSGDLNRGRDSAEERGADEDPAHGLAGAHEGDQGGRQGPGGGLHSGVADQRWDEREAGDREDRSNRKGREVFKDVGDKRERGGEDESGARVDEGGVRRRGEDIAEGSGDGDIEAVEDDGAKDEEIAEEPVIAGPGAAAHDKGAGGREEKADLLAARGTDAEEDPGEDDDADGLERDERDGGREARLVEAPQEQGEVDGEDRAGPEDVGSLAEGEGGERARGAREIEGGEDHSGEGHAREGHEQRMERASEPG